MSRNSSSVDLWGGIALCAVGTVLMVLFDSGDAVATPRMTTSLLFLRRSTLDYLSYYDTSTKNQAFSSGDWGSEWKQYYDETSKRWYSSNGIETQWLD